MNRFLLRTAAVCLLLALAGPAWAGSHGHGSSSGRSGGSMHGFVSHRFSRSTPYHLQHGTKFSHGYYFSGRNHNFWTTQSWSGRYGCYCYWYPGTSSWYYWCAPQSCYYPISYITIAPPVVPVLPVAAAPGPVVLPPGPGSPPPPPVP